MKKIYASRILLAGAIVAVSSFEATAAGRGGFLSAIESSFNETVGTYNATCAKKYYVDDMNAIRQKIGMQ